MTTFYWGLKTLDMLVHKVFPETSMAETSLQKILSQKWFLNLIVLWPENEKNPKPQNYLFHKRYSVVLKLLLLMENANTNAMMMKLFKSPGKLKGPTMKCFEGKIEMSITIRTLFPRTKSLWSHFLFSGVSLDRVAAITPRRIWPHPKQNIQWTSRFLEHKL